jgi:hypothetical protein
MLSFSTLGFGFSERERERREKEDGEINLKYINSK